MSLVKLRGDLSRAIISEVGLSKRSENLTALSLLGGGTGRYELLLTYHRVFTVGLDCRFSSSRYGIAYPACSLCGWSEHNMSPATGKEICGHCYSRGGLPEFTEDPGAGLEFGSDGASPLKKSVGLWLSEAPLLDPLRAELLKDEAVEALMSFYRRFLADARQVY